MCFKRRSLVRKKRRNIFSHSNYSQQYTSCFHSYWMAGVKRPTKQLALFANWKEVCIWHVYILLWWAAHAHYDLYVMIIFWSAQEIYLGLSNTFLNIQSVSNRKSIKISFRFEIKQAPKRSEVNWEDIHFHSYLRVQCKWSTKTTQCFQERDDWIRSLTKQHHFCTLKLISKCGVLFSEHE